MLRSHSIGRHNNKCFYLAVLMGHGNSRQLYRYDLGFTVKEAKENFLKKIETIRVEELSKEERGRLLKAINDEVILDKPPIIVTSVGMVSNHKYHPLPGETASTSFNISVPGTVYVGY